MQVRTRFAPSPTGLLHVGSVRTALYSWLFARHHQGKFMLRIEDTDQARSTQASVETILDGMAWMGLDYDEDLVFQTQRYPRYMEMVEHLLKIGKAYRCTCSPERLETLREQQLAAKQKPRYDGHCRERKISHVIRGDDHINTTPRQINLYHALEAPIPEFAHLPMILGEDGKRLSKRHGAVSVLEFKEEGFLPHALLNYLVRLGWSHGDQEIFSLAEMIANFDLSAVSRGVSGFNYDKLLWLNQHYIKNDSAADIAKTLAAYFTEAGIDLNQGPPLEDIVTLQADRAKTLVELRDKSRYFYEEDLVYDAEAVAAHLTPGALDLLAKFKQRLQDLSLWQRAEIHHCLKDLVSEQKIGFGQLAQPLRVAVTGSTMSPSIDATLELIGKQRVLERLEKAQNIGNV